MANKDLELKQEVESYVRKKYSAFIKQDNIIYGKAIFSIEMFIDGSLETIKANPDQDVFYIVDYMFDYFCN